jgi:hypothetical protein
MEEEIDDLVNRTFANVEIVKNLISFGFVKAAFINYLNSELIVVTKEGFKQQSLNVLKSRLPIWIESLYFSKDPSILWSTSSVKINKISTIKIVGSPLRLMLMYPELERIL